MEEKTSYGQMVECTSAICALGSIKSDKVETNCRFKKKKKQEMDAVEDEPT